MAKKSRGRKSVQDKRVNWAERDVATHLASVAVPRVVAWEPEISNHAFARSDACAYCVNGSCKKKKS